MIKKWTDDQEKQIRLSKLSFAGTAPLADFSPRSRQLPLQPLMPRTRLAKKQKYEFEEVDTPIGRVIRASILLGATSSTTETPAMVVLKSLVDALENLRLLEAIYGYVEGNTSKVVAIADDLSSVQRDAIWRVNLDFQRRYPNIDVDIRILQRRGRALSDVYEDDGSAVIAREHALV